MLQRWLDALFPGLGWSVDVSDRPVELQKTSKRRDDVLFYGPRQQRTYRTFSEVIAAAMSSGRSLAFVEDAAKAVSRSRRRPRRALEAEEEADDSDEDADDEPGERSTLPHVKAARADAAPKGAAKQLLRVQKRFADGTSQALQLPASACARDFRASCKAAKDARTIRLPRFKPGTATVARRFFLSDTEPLEDLVCEGGAGAGAPGLTVEVA